MTILNIENLTKQYAKTNALDGVSLEIPAQSIFGLLGPNGAGKTTLIRIITGILRADSGKISFDNSALNITHSSQMGYMPEERGLYKKMKVWEQLVYLAQLKGMEKKAAKKKIFEWLEKFEMKDWWNKKIEELSKGMQQKVQFVSTVVHEPKLIILDEPFSGLDPINSNLIKDEIEELRVKGSTIIFSTHRMEQVEEICENIALVNKGHIILRGAVGEVKQRFKKNLFRIDSEARLPVAGLSGFEISEQTETSATVRLTAAQKPNDLLRAAVSDSTQVTAFNEILPSLNEIFIQQVKASENHA